MCWNVFSHTFGSKPPWSSSTCLSNEDLSSSSGTFPATRVTPYLKINLCHRRPALCFMWFAENETLSVFCWNSIQFFFFLNVASLISLTHATCLSWWGWWFHILMQQTSHQELVYFQELACMKSLVVLFTALTRHEARRVSKHRMIVANGFCHMPSVTVLWRKRLSHVERRPPRCLVVSL